MKAWELYFTRAGKIDVEKYAWLHLSLGEEKGHNVI